MNLQSTRKKMLSWSLGAVLSEGQGHGILKSSPLCPSSKRSALSADWLLCAMFVLVNSLCLAFSGADIEFDFVLMTSACSHVM